MIESYYRSGLNAWLNAQLTGRPMANMFPMFHIQIPTRVLYINGFKVGVGGGRSDSGCCFYA